MDDWTVLLVDDEKEFASTLAERLNLRGLRCRTAYSGRRLSRPWRKIPPKWSFSI